MKTETTTTLVPTPTATPGALPSTAQSWSIGYDRTWDLLRDFQTGTFQKPSSYPPYNILKLPDDRFEVEVAIAGFSKDDITISVKDSILTIKGKKPDTLYFEREAGIAEYLHRGIGARSFTQTFALGEYMHVIGARFEDGILTVELERILPEELKERVIEIR